MTVHCRRCFWVAVLIALTANSGAAAPPTSRPTVPEQVCIANAQAKIAATAGGGFSLRFGGDQFVVESSVTALGKTTALWFQPGADGANAAAARVQRPDAQTLSVDVDGQTYTWKRQVVLNRHRIEVSDSFTNKSDEALGLIVRHQLRVSGPVSAYRLYGLVHEGFPERTLGSYSPDNPTLFMARNKNGLGLVAEDKVMRLQAKLTMGPTTGRVSCEHFGLAPMASYTMRWALYPTTADYYDFINAVRRDWNVNFTVLGPFEFVDAKKYQTSADGERLRAMLARRSIKLFGLLPWFEYRSEFIDRDQYKRIMRSAMRVIKSVQPDARCLALLETNLAPVKMSFFKGTLPADMPYGAAGRTYPVGHGPGKYGYPAPPKAAKIIDASPWRDSVSRDAEGRPLLDTFYADNYEGLALHLMVYPRRNNHWYRQMMDKLRFLLDEVGMDGVYFDQFSYSSGYPERDLTYDCWIGHTVDIDPATGKVTRKYTHLASATAAACQDWVRFVLRKEKLVVANSLPATMELQSLPVFRFMETAGYDPMVEGAPKAEICAIGQLASPIGLGYAWDADVPGAKWSGKPKGAEFFMRTICAQLRYGLLYYSYGADFPGDGEIGGGYGPLNHMFPLTPEELHEGWVLGKERLITCVSGTFPWRRDSAPRHVRLFDARGLEKPSNAQTEPAADGYRIRLQLKDWREVAVIE